MWYILVFVTLPHAFVDQKPIFIFQYPTFETSQQCIVWANENTDTIQYTILDAYNNAKGHEGVYCVEDKVLNEMHEDGVLKPNPKGTMML